MRMVRLRVASGQTLARFFLGSALGKRNCTLAGAFLPLPGYNDAVQITLRGFQEVDFETLWKIDQACFAPGIAYSRPELMSYLHLSRSSTVVAEGRSPGSPQPVNILGFIVAHAGSKGLGHIITIDVLPAAQRLGVGSRLLSAAEVWMRAKQCSKSHLETAVDNLAALAFYKRHDYLLLKTLPRYYSNGVDAFVLQKDLLSSAEAS
jgi:ribosomal-protein-alanine N-acetyltransferase